MRRLPDEHVENSDFSSRNGGKKESDDGLNDNIGVFCSEGLGRHPEDEGHCEENRKPVFEKAAEFHPYLLNESR